MDIFDLHRGVVHQNSDGQSQAAQRHNVNRFAEGAEDADGNQNRQRNRDGDDNRAAPTAQKQQNHGGGEAGGDNCLADHAAHRGAHENGLIGDRLDLQFLGKPGGDPGKHLSYVLDDLQGGTLAHLQDGHQHASLAVAQNDIGLGRIAVADVRHVADVDGGVVHRLDRHVVDLVHAGRAVVEIHVIFERADFRRSSGKNQILGVDGRHHVGRRQPLGLQQVGPDIDHHLPLLAAVRIRAGGPLHGGEGGADIVDRKIE